LGPAGLQRGDTLAVIYGAEIPFVFRKNSNGQYRLIGESYVDGVMDGEVLEMGLQSTTFDIA
jgi:hypothetical protein